MAIAEVGGGSQRGSAGTGGVGAASLNISFPGNVTSGNFGIVAGGIWNASAITSVTTTRSSGASIGAVNTIFGSTGVSYAGGTGYAFISYFLITSTGPLTMNVATSVGSGNFINLTCDEFSGVNATPLDVNGGELTGGPSGPGTDVANDTITTLTANDLIIAALVNDVSIGVYQAGTGYTAIRTDNASTDQPFGVEFQIVGAINTYNVPWGWATTNNIWSIVNGAFKETVAGATVLGAPSPPVTRVRLRAY